MDLSTEEIQKNIAALKNKVGDARTGGKGTVRRKVKVVSKPAVLLMLFRPMMTRRLEILSES